MQVCYLINQLAPGGAPTLLLDLVRNTDDEDVSFTICFIEGEDALVSDFEGAGAEVVDFRAAVKFDPRALWRMVAFFREREFDVLHAHLPYSQTLGRICARLGKVGVVVSTQHNVPDNYHPITRAFERWSRGLDDATVAVSEGVEHAFRGETHRFNGTLDDGWCTIANGIDVSDFNDAVRAADPHSIDHDIPDDAVVYLNVARYVPAKSQTDLIAAMSSVVDDVPEAHLFVVGWGELEATLRTEVRERDLEDSVTITGRVPSVHEYYALADVFVSSSVFEGLPITHLEAMAAELPIVATSIPGVREVVIDGETGVLTPPGSPDELAEAMKSLADSDLRASYATNGFERVSREYTIGATVSAHLELYRSLLER